MIIPGVRKKILKSEHIPGACPLCKEKNCLQMTVYLQYISFFWIPTFPIEKREDTVCSNCNTKLQLRYMSPAFAEIFKTLKATTITPKWIYSGTVIIIVGLIAGVFFYKVDANKTRLRVHSPQKDDIFEMRTKQGNFTLYKVIKANRDSVYFVANKYEISDASNLDQLYDKGADGFETSTTYGIPMSRFIKMDNDGDVFGFKSR